MLSLVVIAASSSRVLPSVQSLVSDWQLPGPNTDAPVINSLAASVGSSPRLALDFNSWTVPPFIGGTSAASGGGNLALLLDGDPLVAPTHFRQSAFAAERRRTCSGAPMPLPPQCAGSAPLGLYDYSSALRLGSAANSLLFEVNISCPAAAASIVVHPTVLVRRASAFPWVMPYPNDTNKFTFARNGSRIDGVDTVSGAASSVRVWATAAAQTPGAAGAPRFAFTNPPAGSPGHAAVVTLRGSVAIGRTVAEAQQLSDALASDDAWSAAWVAEETAWERRWERAFGGADRASGAADAAGLNASGAFSGALPVLSAEGEEGAALERIYYNSILTVLGTQRAYGGGADAKNVYLTSSGNALAYDCASCYPHIDGKLEVGGAAQYYWDVKQAAVLLSLLDPAGLRAAMRVWLADGLEPLYQSNGIDLLTGQRFGAFYAFNSWSVFFTLMTYVQVSGDIALLSAPLAANCTTGLGVLVAMATSWTNLTMNCSGARADDGLCDARLADYGAFAGNFLECVSSYTGVVPALQATNVMMMRSLAALLDAQAAGATAGGAATGAWSAAQLRAAASVLFNATVEKLAVVDGATGAPSGVYRCLHSGSATAKTTATEVRHVVDFFTLALCASRNGYVGAGAGTERAAHLSASQVRDLIYRYISCESFSPFDSLPPITLTPLRIAGGRDGALLPPRAVGAGVGHRALAHGRPRLRGSLGPRHDGLVRRLASALLRGARHALRLVRRRDGDAALAGEQRAPRAVRPVERRPSRARLLYAAGDSRRRCANALQVNDRCESLQRRRGRVLVRRHRSHRLRVAPPVDRRASRRRRRRGSKAAAAPRTLAAHATAPPQRDSFEPPLPRHARRNRLRRQRRPRAGAARFSRSLITAGGYSDTK